MVKMGSLDVRWTSPVSQYVAPVAFWLASRHVKWLSGPVVRLAADSAALSIALVKVSDAFMGFYVSCKSKGEIEQKLDLKKTVFGFEACTKLWIDLALCMIFFGPKGLSEFPFFSRQTAKAGGIVFIISYIATPALSALEGRFAKNILPNSSWAKAIERQESLAKHLKREDWTNFIVGLVMHPNWWGLHAKLELE